MYHRNESFFNYRENTDLHVSDLIHNSQKKVHQDSTSVFFPST